MSAPSCPYWREYDSVAGTICYCEVAAFNKKLTAEEMRAIGCTQERRQVCLSRMEARVGSSAVPTVAYDPPNVIADSVAKTSEKKAGLATGSLLVLGVLAGAYIAMGAQLSTVVTNDLAARLGDGLSRLAGGITFSVGLIMVILAGAELFTGNNLVMALGLYDRRITWQALLRNWTLVYLANFLGALLLVAIFYATNLWLANGAMVGAKAVLTAQAKVNLTFSEAFFRGILCNWLVCLAVWLANAGKDAVSKILGIMLPVAAFVTSGFEHSIANMYFIPIGILLSDQVQVAGALARLGQDPVAVGAALTWIKFLVANLIPVTLGNIVGGAIFVGGSYWAVYLHRPAAPKVKAAPETKAAPAAAPATGGRMLSATGRGGKV